VVDKALAGHGGVFFDDLVFFHSECYARHLWNQSTDRVAEGSYCEVKVRKNGFEGKSVGVEYGLFEERLGYFEADEVMEGFGRESILCDLYDVESEFGTDVRAVVVRVSDRVAVFGAEFGETIRD